MSRVIKPYIKKTDLEPGYIYAHIPVVEATMINGEIVWYKNKWKNFLLKIKFFFVKPKYYKLMKKYKNKPINPKFYGTVNVDEL
tara:strand:- start:33830 stop:34081 length:252 start_codon:yes stop_codon:yes gene_type:complete